jgi:GNAT superfamily N-acetyltransferase
MIEKAYFDDVEEILSLINTSNREAYRNIIAQEHFREPVLSLEKLLEDFERKTFYVYKSGGRVVGVAALQIESEETGKIHWVYVLPEHQRRGIGTALVTCLEREGRGIGLRKLRLTTVEKARWAVNFYEKLGHDLADKIERPWGFDVFMEKELEPSQQKTPPEDTSRTPGLARSPKGRFDAQAALRALEAGDEEGLVATLMTVKWGRTGYQAMVTIEEALGPGTEALYDWACCLADRPEPAARAIAAPLFRHYWPSRPDEVQARLLRLADDEDWLVREAAHSTMGSLLIAHFDALYPILQSWARHPSANVRRGVAIAARRASNERREEWAEILLNLVKPLLADHDKYVRKNLGSYAIGDGLLRCYPELTLRYLEEWAESEDEQVRWNVAMSFASYGGNKQWEKALEILTRLATDERRYVWRAVASALRYIGRRHLEQVCPILEEWLRDERRRRPAEVALKYIGG